MHVNCDLKLLCFIAALSTRLFRAQELKLKTQHLQNVFDMFQYQFLKIFESSALIQIPRNYDYTCN